MTQPRTRAILDAAEKLAGAFATPGAHKRFTGEERDALDALFRALALQKEDPMLMHHAPTKDAEGRIVRAAVTEMILDATPAGVVRRFKGRCTVPCHDLGVDVLGESTPEDKHAHFWGVLCPECGRCWAFTIEWLKGVPVLVTEQSRRDEEPLSEGVQRALQDDIDRMTGKRRRDEPTTELS